MPGTLDACAACGPAFGPGTGCAEAVAAGGGPPGKHHHAGADLDAVEQVGDILVQHADAARGDELADRRGLVGAMDPIDGGTEIHRARAQRIAGAAGHEARQIGLAFDHLRRRMPIRPLGLAGDLLHAGPGEAVAADADAVADRAPVAQHVIEIGVRGIDDQRSRRLLGGNATSCRRRFGASLRRAGFRLFFRRQRGQHHRLAVGAHAAWRLRPIR